ncbi:McrBC 5-methylcytosine restriction system component [Schinkia azotoformans MEV2011]|uniref:McrBC 5-methylcytosine restriction system component n=1 Tax=Schinkia azotoformans MEV2011 TaxID=1348973 RepID=A0A072NS44_SCHAZ|nr:hypothetical protein [Schinkia azotoformans]KEF39703.1 McrBC 5-methylcytosine restriction system component [Schinkia azotoformans MEV2011]
MHRIILQEYGTQINIEEIADNCNITAQSMRALLRKANSRIMTALSLRTNPLIMDSDTVRAVNIAGAIRLSAQIELEIMPKYLGFSENDTHWKEDFYLLSTLSKHGRLLEGDNIHTVTAYRSSLYDIAGRALAENFVPLRRNMLRKYRRDLFEDYSIEGEIRFEDAFVKHPDGIPQEKVTFDKKNEYNATILAAMQYVQPHVTDIKVQRILQESITILQPQNSIQMDRPRLALPARDLRWKSEYDLAYDIIHGMGVVFTDGNILSPGFVVSTWQIWEWLITNSVRIGESDLKVFSQKAFRFGTVQNNHLAPQQHLYVYPDVCATQPDTGEIVYLVDAKYKLLSANNSGEANRADLYEALAFCQSTRCRYLFLAYPIEYTQGDELRVNLAATYQLEGNTIFAIQIPVQGLATPGGLHRFSNMLTSGIKDILEYYNEVRVG